MLLLSLLPALIIAAAVYFILNRAQADGTTTKRGMIIAVATFVVITVALDIVIANNR